MDLDRTFPVLNFLSSVASRHYSSDAKEANILIVVRCFKIVVKLGVINIAIYGKSKVFL